MGGEVGERDGLLLATGQVFHGRTLLTDLVVAQDDGEAGPAGAGLAHPGPHAPVAGPDHGGQAIPAGLLGEAGRDTLGLVAERREEDVWRFGGGQGTAL